MTHKLIKTDNYLLVVDDSEIKEGDWYKTPLGIYSQFNGTEKLLEGTKKVSAHLPLNGSHILEGVDLLPPYSRHQEEGVEELAEEVYGKGVNQDYEEGFVDGYNKAREKYRFTKQDISNAVVRIYDVFMDDTLEAKMLRLKGVSWHIQNILQSLHQYPTEFECEMKYFEVDMGLGEECIEYGEIPQKITTAQGIQWVGKYK